MSSLLSVVRLIQFNDNFKCMDIAFPESQALHVVGVSVSELYTNQLISHQLCTKHKHSTSQDSWIEIEKIIQFFQCCWRLLQNVSLSPPSYRNASLS